MERKLITELLETIGQTHLLIGLDTVERQQQKQFMERIQRHGKKTLEMQRLLIGTSHRPALPHATSPNFVLTSSDLKDDGEQVVREGKMALLLLAGGQGSRLGFDGPKGICPVSPIEKKSLFQLIFEKIKVLSEKYNKDLQIAVMTSSKNNAETIDFLKHHNFFGVKKSQIGFFVQDDMPFMSTDGSWLLQAPRVLAEGPCGNGAALLDLYRCGILNSWEEVGIEYINIIPVDNPLAEPYDFELAALHAAQGADIAVKAVERSCPLEPVGVLLAINGKLHIVEYSDMDQADKSALDKNGALLFPLANTGLMSFSIEFIKKNICKMSTIPWHIALKNPRLPYGGVTEQMVWKFEQYIFDLLPFAQNARVIKSERSFCYSPLKNSVGDKSCATVARDLISRYKQIYEELSGLAAPNCDFELAPEFWYPSENFRKYWKARPLPNKKYINSYPL
jgi:UDP-N-acetylglucosamine/UDP-N-acetylgalactosamine diphosphorylase